jgi:hypothetical protein
MEHRAGHGAEAGGATEEAGLDVVWGSSRCPGDNDGRAEQD